MIINSNAVPPPIKDEPKVSTTILEMADVINKVNDELCDEHIMCKHIAAGTTATYLDHVLGEVIMDMTIIPVARAILELESVDDAASVSQGFRTVAFMLSELFNMDYKSVETLMLERMNSFPIDDVREAYMRKEKHLLH